MMKNYFTLLGLISTLSVCAQTVPNGNFEYWDEIAFSMPESWNNSNVESVPSMGWITATEVTGYSGSAIHLETVGNGQDMIFGYVSNTYGDPMAGEGGQPYSQQPVGVEGYLRYNLPGQDTALFLVIFKKNGVVISTDLYKIRNETGVQDSFIPFSYSLSLNEIPDTVIVAAASSNGITEEGVEIGSWLELDELQFTGDGIDQPIVNGDFEDWNDESYFNLNDWERFGREVERTSDAWDGDYAIQAGSNLDGDGVYPSGVTTGHVIENNIVGGNPYSSIQDTLTGYYKYFTPSSVDMGMITVTLTNNMSPAGGGVLNLSATNEYTYFELPFQAFSTPDTLRVDIMSSSWPFENAHGESELIVDRLQLKSEPLLIREQEERRWTPFPNPALHSVSMQYPDGMERNGSVYLYDASGAIVNVRPVCTTERVWIGLDGLSPGVYIIEFRDSHHAVRESFIRR